MLVPLSVRQMYFSELFTETEAVNDEDGEIRGAFASRADSHGFDDWGVSQQVLACRRLKDASSVAQSQV